MGRKDWFVIILIVIGAIIIASLLNILLSIEGFIPTKFSQSEWFSFWSTYLTGIFALVIGYIAISFGNKNSELALKQQTELLRKQENNRIKAEILDIIEKQYQLFNILKHSSAIIAINYDELPKMLQHVNEDRALVHEQCNTWNLYIQLNLQSPSLALYVNDYQKNWSEAVSLLDKYLKLQNDYLQQNQIVGNAIKAKNICDRILTELNQSTRSTNNGQRQETNNKIKKFQQERNEHQCTEDTANKEIKKLISEINDIHKKLIEAQDNIERASIMFLNQIRKMDFTEI